MLDVSVSPLSRLLPDRCTQELRLLQAELAARHSFREATRLLQTFLPCSPPNHSSVRNRLQGVAKGIEAVEAAAPQVAEVPLPQGEADTEIVVMIDGAHVRAVPSHHSRHIDVTVGKVEAAGKPPRGALHWRRWAPWSRHKPSELHCWLRVG